ncbi:MAG: cobaltochelatase subunit CobN [Methanolobus sp.]
MHTKRGLELITGLLLLLALTATVSADENSYELVDNTFSGTDGLYSFEDLPDGDYTLVAVNWSDQKMLWYTGIKNVTLQGSDLADVNIKVNSTTNIDVDYIYGLLNRSSITGMTYVMSTDYPRQSSVVLLGQQTKELIADTESDESGTYTFNDIPDGDYSIVAVNYSTAKETWYKGITNVTLTGTDLTEQDIKISSSTDIDENYILGLLKKSSISGMTYVMSTDYPRQSSVVLLDQQTKELIADTESNEAGTYSFNDIPDGDYSIVAVNYSSAKETWYKGIINVTLTGTDLADQDIKISSSTDIDENYILGLLKKSSISGMTYVMKTDYPRQSLVVLLQTAGDDGYVELPSAPVEEEEDNSTEEPADDTGDSSEDTGDDTSSSAASAYEYFLSLTTDELGEFIFDNLPAGEYRISAVNWSSAMGGIWLVNVTDVTVDGGMPFDIGNLSMRSNDDVDSEAIFSMMNETYLSGKTIGKRGDNKISDLVLTNQFGEYVADTTCDSEGEFLLEGIRNGEYTLSAVNWSSAMGGMWLNNVTEITVENGLPVEIGNISMRSSDEIDPEEILSMMNETSISGKTIGKRGDNKISDVVLTNRFGEYITSTTANTDGEFLFEGIRNGEYTVSAVNWSSAMGGMWLSNVTEVTLENGLPVEIGNMSMRSSDEIDPEEILSMMNVTSISGKTIGKRGDDKISEIVLMRKRSVAMSNEPHLNVAFVTGYSSYENDFIALEERIDSNTELNIDFSYYVTTSLPDDIDLSNEDIIYIVMVTQSADILDSAVQGAIDNGAVVIGSNTYLPESDYTIPDEFADQGEFKTHLAKYWSGGSSDESNFDNLIFYLAQEYYGRNDLTVEQPTGLERAIYHPAMTTTPTEYFTGDADEYFSWYASRTDGHAFDASAPTVGITYYKSYYPDDMDPIDKLIENFESNGVNVVTCYGNANNYLDGYLNHSSETKVDVVVSFHYRGNYFDLEELDVPVMNAVLNGYMNTSEWIETTTPLPVTNMLRIYGPETEGLIDPIMIGAKETITVDGDTVEKYIGHDEQIDWLVERAIAQAELGTEEETDKKVAIIYYNHGGGKDNIGASYLEVTPSIVNLLEGMADDGYDVDSSLIPNKTELVDLMVYQGRNVGTWAPGELESLVETGEVELIPESTYLSWFNELPEERRKK